MSLFKKQKGTEITPSSPQTRALREHRSGFIDDFDSIFEDFRRSFDNLMRPYFPFDYLPKDIAEFGREHYAPLDLIDEGDHYKLQVELPGMTNDDVEVQITSDSLILKAQKESYNEKSEKNYLHRERYYSTWKREVHFPEEVRAEKAEGSMKDGILELTIPKKEPKAKEQVYTIPIT